jgi:hypothetical protein
MISLGIIGYGYWGPHLVRNFAEARHFIECIEHSKEPVTGGMAGLRMVETLAAASQSMRERGRLVDLPGASHRTAGA